MYFKDFRDSYFCSLAALDVRCRYCGFLFMRKIAQLSAVHILTTCWPRLLLQRLTANENKRHSHSGMQCFVSNLTSSAHIFTSFLSLTFVFVTLPDAIFMLQLTIESKSNIHFFFVPTDCSIFFSLTHLLLQHLKPRYVVHKVCVGTGSFSHTAT